MRLVFSLAVSTVLDKQQLSGEGGQNPNTDRSQDVNHRKLTGLSHLILKLHSKAVRIFFKEKKGQGALQTVS